jgi:hypothetical protein
MVVKPECGVDWSKERRGPRRVPPVPSYVVESTHHPLTVTGFRVLRATEGTRRYSKERTVTPSVLSGEIHWSEETYNIFEHDRAAKPTLDLALQRIHPDDRDLVQQTLDRSTNEGTNFDLEHRLLMPEAQSNTSTFQLLVEGFVGQFRSCGCRDGRHSSKTGRSETATQPRVRAGLA